VLVKFNVYNDLEYSAKVKCYDSSGFDSSALTNETTKAVCDSACVQKH